jgi:uncharacterized protein (TIRG00374 family)
MAQIIRYVMMFVAFMPMLVISVIVLAFDHQINRTVLGLSAALIISTIIFTVAVVYMLSSRKRLVKISKNLCCWINLIVEKLTFGHKKNILSNQKLQKVFMDLHQDYVEIRYDKKILSRTFWWSVLSNSLDASLLLVTFLALGFWVNPAAMVIAYGLSSIAAILSATPGGVGIYEGIMIAFLVSSGGVPADAAIAGTLLARATLFVGTMAFGYIFYHLTINGYGKSKKHPKI